MAKVIGKVEHIYNASTFIYHAYDLGRTEPRWQHAMSRFHSPMEHDLDGVPLMPDAVAAASQAAAAAGLSVQEWLTRIILASAYPRSVKATETDAMSSAAPPAAAQLTTPHPRYDLSGAAKVRQALAQLATRAAARHAATDVREV